MEEPKNGSAREGISRYAKEHHNCAGKGKGMSGDLEVREKNVRWDERTEVVCAMKSGRMLNDGKWRQRRKYFAKEIKYVHEFSLHALPSLYSLTFGPSLTPPFESGNRLTVHIGERLLDLVRNLFHDRTLEALLFFVIKLLTA